MIYIRVEMWPKGDRNRASVLGEATIENTGGGTKTKANYRARISKRPGFKRAKKDRVPTSELVQNLFTVLTQIQDPEVARVCRPASSSVWKETTVESFPRSVRGVWDLLHRALCSCVGSRN